MSHYRGRFAPSPTGPLHAGSLVAALASWLDAKAHGGHWLVRIEDVDTPRCVDGADTTILQQLNACGLQPDAPPLWQSTRIEHYQQALQRLVDRALAYPCACSRKAIDSALSQRGLARPRHGELVYPGTCRNGLAPGAVPRAWRLNVQTHHAFENNRPLTHDSAARCAINSVAFFKSVVQWLDRRLGPQTQDLAIDVGDFVILRADGLFAYQLAVVVDDAASAITHVVRGEDLADNTARQLWLQRALALPHPIYLHTALVRDPRGEKLSKQNGAPALNTSTPKATLQSLSDAAQVLGLAPTHEESIGLALGPWTQEWRMRFT